MTNSLVPKKLNLISTPLPGMKSKPETAVCPTPVETNPAPRDLWRSKSRLISKQGARNLVFRTNSKNVPGHLSRFPRKPPRLCGAAQIPRHLGTAEPYLRLMSLRRELCPPERLLYLVEGVQGGHAISDRSRAQARSETGCGLPFAHR
jgi:hypothetical protein